MDRSDDISLLRIVIGLIGSSATAGFLFSAQFESIGAWLFFSFVSLVFICLIGLPLYLLIWRTGRVTAVKAGISGVVGGAMVALVLLGPSRAVEQATEATLFLTQIGFMAGAVFYLIMHGFYWKEQLPETDDTY
ncbi:hypothetical protein HFP51_01945 [Parasphingopyxis sp. CP4]|uniref:hypothetical protein n=1 Tax=Parasphingopyxis sp. CP4 TaxID=2724527 RepID=UPI0015A4D5DB|nr:hypothetical protein [Parasphingopyxis sp. CP4]QLC21053.1 hypothetical protein HFP51_01945 [Parasphingopyxis sp. CP4]